MIPKGAALRATVIETTAVAVVAAVLGLWVVSLGRSSAIDLNGRFELASRLQPTVVVLVAVGVLMSAARFTVLARLGWFITAGGLGAAAVMTYGTHTVSGFNGGSVDVAVAACWGVVLGGIWLAATAQPRFGRVAVSAGVAIGLSLSVPLSLLLRPLTWLSDNHTLVAAGPIAVAAASAIAAGMIASKRTGTFVAPRRLPAGLIRTVVPVVLLVVSGLAVQHAMLGQEPDWEELLRGRDPSNLNGVVGIGYHVEDHVLPSSLALGLLVGILLMGCAFHLGRTAAARWILVCLALAAPIGQVISNGFVGGPGNLDPSIGWQFLVAFVSVVAGVLLAWRADRVLPWDAIGVGVVGVAQLLMLVLPRRELRSLRELLLMTLLAGVGLAMGNGLVRLARTSQDHTFAGLAVLGFAALMLAGQLLATLAINVENTITGLRVVAPALLTLTASIVLTVLFFAGNPPIKKANA